MQPHATSVERHPATMPAGRYYIVMNSVTPNALCPFLSKRCLLMSALVQCDVYVLLLLKELFGFRKAAGILDNPSGVGCGMWPARAPVPGAAGGQLLGPRNPSFGLIPTIQCAS